MTGPDPSSRGRDFLIGFIPSAIVTGVATTMLFVDEALKPISVVFAGLFMAALLAVSYQRWYIAIGIGVVLVAIPLLLVGACFSFFSWS